MHAHTHARTLTSRHVEHGRGVVGETDVGDSSDGVGAICALHRDVVVVDPLRVQRFQGRKDQTVGWWTQIVKRLAQRQRLIRAGGGREGGRSYGGGGRGRLYTYRYTVTTRMTPALRWAAMRAILMFHNCEGQSHKTVSTDHNF